MELSTYRKQLRKMTTEHCCDHILRQPEVTEKEEELVDRLLDMKTYCLQLEDDFAKAQSTLVKEIQIKTQLQKNWCVRISVFFKKVFE